MVRFYWHVDDGCSAHVPVNGVTLAPDHARLAVEMDVPGVAGSALGMLTMPPCPEGSNSPKLKRIGVIIAHDSDATSWQGPLLSSVAQCLARKGFMVMRNYCNLKELRRLRMFEKAVDTASKSPYATSGGVDSWLLVGMGNGARVAATISSKSKAAVAGLAVVSYPLQEATPPAGKGAGFPDSTTQLVKCQAPLLVLHAERDSRCSVPVIRQFCRQQRPQKPGPRFAVLPAVDEHLMGQDADLLNARTLVCRAVVDFAEALLQSDGTDVDIPSIPSAHDDVNTLPLPPKHLVADLGVITDLPPPQPYPAASPTPATTTAATPAAEQPAPAVQASPPSAAGAAALMAAGQQSAPQKPSPQAPAQLTTAASPVATAPASQHVAGAAGVARQTGGAVVHAHPLQLPAQHVQVPASIAGLASPNQPGHVGQIGQPLQPVGAAQPMHAITAHHQLPAVAQVPVTQLGQAGVRPVGQVGAVGQMVRPGQSPMDVPVSLVPPLPMAASPVAPQMPSLPPGLLQPVVSVPAGVPAGVPAAVGAVGTTPAVMAAAAAAAAGQPSPAVPLFRANQGAAHAQMMQQQAGVLAQHPGAVAPGGGGAEQK